MSSRVREINRDCDSGAMLFDEERRSAAVLGNINVKDVVMKRL